MSRLLLAVVAVLCLVSVQAVVRPLAVRCLHFSRVLSLLILEVSRRSPSPATKIHRKRFILLFHVACDTACPIEQSETTAAATAAQRNRLVGMVRVKSNAPAVDAAAVEAKLQQFADLQKIDQTATKVRLLNHAFLNLES